MEMRCAYDSMVKIEDLLLNPRNPNKHDKKQIRLIAKILQHQGWRRPVIVSNQSGLVVCGHGRIEAAKLNKWVEVPVDYQDYNNEDDEYADMVADNAIANLARLDMKMINEDFVNLNPELDLELLGIDNFKIDLNEDEIQEVKEKKYILELEFPDEQAMKDEYSNLCSQGLIVRVKR
jgi:hypothetical protein